MRGQPCWADLAPARVLGANDRIRVGVLGSGHRARYVMELFKRVPDVEFVAICDVYAPARVKRSGSRRRRRPGLHQLS